VFKDAYKDLIIVDNNSQGKDIKLLESIYPGIKIYFLQENMGFSRANNFGASQSDSEYLVFINPDIAFIEDCISPIIDYMKNNSNAGACGPMLLNGDLSVQNSTGFKMGLLYEFAEAFFLINLIRGICSLKFRKAAKNGSICRVSWLSAATLVIRKKVFEEIGGFDSSFFLNYEDIDLCKRLRERGFENFYFPANRCIHYDHQSFKDNYEILVTSRYKSRLIYAGKHYNKLLRLMVLLLHIFGLLLRMPAVNLFYSGIEKRQRCSGYRYSLKLYFKNIFNNGGLEF
jgi:hypothetical protein